MNLEVLEERWEQLPPQLRKQVARRACRKVALLCDIITENRYSNILEIGTFLGRTACHFAAACAPFGGKVTTINVDATEVRQAQELASKLGIDNIEFVTGDSLKSIPTLEGGWDMVFIDGLHSHKYSMGEYRLVLPKLKERATVVFDDAGAVHEPDSKGDGGVPKTISMIDGTSFLPNTNLAVKEFCP